MNTTNEILEDVNVIDAKIKELKKQKESLLFKLNANKDIDEKVDTYYKEIYDDGYNIFKLSDITVLSSNRLELYWSEILSVYKNKNNYEISYEESKRYMTSCTYDELCDRYIELSAEEVFDYIATVNKIRSIIDK